MWIFLCELLKSLTISVCKNAHFCFRNWGLVGRWSHIFKSGFYALFSALCNFSALLVTTSKEICDHYSLHVIFAKSLMSKQIRYTIFYVWNVSGSLFIRPEPIQSSLTNLIKYYVFIPFCNAEFKVLDILKRGSSSWCSSLRLVYKSKWRNFSAQ